MVAAAACSFSSIRNFQAQQSFAAATRRAKQSNGFGWIIQLACCCYCCLFAHTYVQTQTHGQHRRTDGQAGKQAGRPTHTHSIPVLPVHFCSSACSKTPALSLLNVAAAAAAAAIFSFFSCSLALAVEKQRQTKRLSIESAAFNAKHRVLYHHHHGAVAAVALPVSPVSFVRRRCYCHWRFPSALLVCQAPSALSKFRFMSRVAPA